MNPLVIAYLKSKVLDYQAELNKAARDAQLNPSPPFQQYFDSAVEVWLNSVELIASVHAKAGGDLEAQFEREYRRYVERLAQNFPDPFVPPGAYLSLKYFLAGWGFEVTGRTGDVPQSDTFEV